MKHQIQLAAAITSLYQASYCYADASQPISPPSLRQPLNARNNVDNQKRAKTRRNTSLLDADTFDVEDDFAIYDNDDQIDLNIDFSNELPYDDEGIESLFASKSDGMGDDSEYDGVQQQYGQGTEKGALYDAYNLLHTLAQVWLRSFL